MPSWWHVYSFRCAYAQVLYFGVAYKTSLNRFVYLAAQLATKLVKEYLIMAGSEVWCLLDFDTRGSAYFAYSHTNIAYQQLLWGCTPVQYRATLHLRGICRY